MASPSHRRPRGKRRGLSAPAVAVAAVGLLVSLVVALTRDGGSDTVRTTATATTKVTSAAGADAARPNASPTATGGTPEAQSSTASPAAPKPSTTTPVRPPSSATPTTVPRPASGGAPLAGRIAPGITYSGVATHYDAGDGDGACLYGPSADRMTAAMNTTDYETSKACGAYVLVRAAGGASVTVRITNECPAPCAPGQLDLSREAFAELAGLSAGRIAVTWSLLSPGTSETLSIRYKTGSSSHWCGIQAMGHRNPLARLEVATGSGWQRLTRTEYNYFLSPDGTGCGGALRLTDIYGQQLTVDGIAVRPDAVQSTRVQFARR
ncbi:hypothetical protein KYY02_07730 [Streptomyces pimonensis]|uniref:RlpA-like protein double-psi beta-barrel domain-containing protein n=1 Tax=Streptomyces pimonensis TaxID=2860288 RepID=A0ABV4IZ72_9ACTN